MKNAMRLSLGLMMMMALGAAFASTPDALLQRAKALLAKEPLIDTHNDLPYMLIRDYNGDISGIDLTVQQPHLCADLPRLRAGGVGAQYWSVFTWSSAMHNGTAVREAARVIDLVHQYVEKTPGLAIATTADDIERLHREGKVASLLGMEGGYMIDGSIPVLRSFYRLGVRYMTLTHFDTTNWADSGTDREVHNGLTEFGENVVREMNRIGMFVDISHVSPETMKDALRVSRAPVIFSHSNAKALSPHARNVPDDVLRLLPQNGGVLHVSFIWHFVTAKHVEWQARRKAALEQFHSQLNDENAIAEKLKRWEVENPHPPATISDVADHIDHIRDVAGIDYIGIGSDYHDVGNHAMVEGLEDLTSYPLLFVELLRRNYSESDLIKIAGGNHLRAMRKMEQVAKELQRHEPPRYDQLEKGPSR